MREETERRVRVLVVEDDSDIATLLSDILEAEGYVPLSVSDATGVNEKLDPPPDLVVLDLRLTRAGGTAISRSTSSVSATRRRWSPSSTARSPVMSRCSCGFIPNA